MFPNQEADVIPPVLAGLSLLLVEDDAELASVMKRWAVWLGVKMDAASLGSDALRLVVEKSYDAVLLDLTLPDMDGSVVYQRLAELCPILGSRVIILTGGAVNDRARAFLEKTSCPVVLKPFDLVSLARQIAQVDRAA